MIHSNHVTLPLLARVDNRIAAHEDGCIVAGAAGMRLLLERLADPDPAALFAAAVVALNARNTHAIEQCLDVAEAIPENAAGVIAAFGWVERDRLAGLVKPLLESSSGHRRRLGIAACRAHAADPGSGLADFLRDEDAGVRAEAIRTLGTLGRDQLISTIAAITDHDVNVQFWAAWSAVLLGDRGAALEALKRIALGQGPHKARAFRLTLQVLGPSAAQRVLQTLTTDPQQLRWVIEGSGITGDPVYAAWLIKHMSDDKTARAAGEAFSVITGSDLALLDLERKPPEDVDLGPNDDPEDPNISMDPDDGLPWPDPVRVQRWWDANANRFQPGERSFCGRPLTREHCLDVLKNGFQRQRILAAHYLCLMAPGTRLFNTSAPAWRQQRLLAATE